MGYFYFDETIQDRGGFIIGALVYSKNDVTPAVHSSIEQLGMRPGVDEFKSGARMDRNPEQAKLRRSLMEILSKTRVGIVVVPIAARASLGLHALLGLKKILSANNLARESHQLFLDQGITFDRAICNDLLSAFGSTCEVHQSQDSKLIGGIQLADLAAHSLGGILLESLGLTSKLVRAGKNSGYDPALEIELDFELWASLRYQLFKASKPKSEVIADDPIDNLTFDVENFGLHISDDCSPVLKETARQRFGTCYLGCIH
ncbi:hypothetical protein [Rhodoferax sp.]|uniref:hypothetical protein n=1 Tax=Rhodoferax sp. TaxID=50421 RepID=UPI0027659B37|nr:hypothetical protein [Rhodoferax sp.]